MARCKFCERRIRWGEEICHRNECFEDYKWWVVWQTHGRFIQEQIDISIKMKHLVNRGLAKLKLNTRKSQSPIVDRRWDEEE